MLGRQNAAWWLLPCIAAQKWRLAAARSRRATNGHLRQNRQLRNDKTFFSAAAVRLVHRPRRFISVSLDWGKDIELLEKEKGWLWDFVRLRSWFTIRLAVTRSYMLSTAGAGPASDPLENNFLCVYSSSSYIP